SECQLAHANAPGKRFIDPLPRQAQPSGWPRTPTDSLAMRDRHQLEHQSFDRQRRDVVGVNRLFMELGADKYRRTSVEQLWLAKAVALRMRLDFYQQQPRFSAAKAVAVGRPDGMNQHRTRMALALAGVGALAVSSSKHDADVRPLMLVARDALKWP